MKRAKYIYLTFLKIFFRDKANIIFIFFFNAFLMVIFGLTLEDKYNLNIDLGVVVQNETKETKKLIAHLSKQPNVLLKTYESKNTMLQDLKNGKLVAGITLKASQTQEGLKIDVLGDPSRKMWLKFLGPGLRLAAIESNTIFTEELNKVDIKTDYVKSKNLKYFDFIFPGLLIFSIMQIGLSGGLTLLMQRKSESLKRLKITPLKKWEFLLGYSMSYLSIMIIQNIFYILLAVIIFDYSFSAPLYLVFAVGLLASLIFIGLGILLSSLVSTVENGNNLISLISFPAAFLCGIFVPIDTLPIFVQWIAKIHPLTYLADIMRSISNYGNPIEKYALVIGIFILLLLIISFTSIRFFKWQEKMA